MLVIYMDSLNTNDQYIWLSDENLLLFKKKYSRK